jgi:hypothetical protein
MPGSKVARWERALMRQADVVGFLDSVTNDAGLEAS